MENSKNGILELSSQDISFEELKRINDFLIHENWRDNGKYDHKKRDIKKKIEKSNAVRKANKENADGVLVSNEKYVKIKQCS